jgi:DNA-binding PadR family transcriptional regulator
MAHGTRGELTLTEAAALALLEIEGERTGYDLLKLASKSIGHVWAPAKSQLYATLRRLDRAGLAVSRTVPQERRPDRQLFRITPAGRERLDRWLAHVDGSDVQATRLKIFVGGLMPRELLVSHVEALREDALARLEVFAGIDRTNTRRGHDYFHYLLLRYGVEHAETTVRWADGVLRELRARAKASAH